jgi:hypothetical protein
VSTANHRFEFEKRRQQFISTHSEALIFLAMRARNENRSPATIQG